MFYGLKLQKIGKSRRQKMLFSLISVEDSKMMGTNEGSRATSSVQLLKLAFGEQVCSLHNPVGLHNIDMYATRKKLLQQSKQNGSEKN